MPFPSAKVIHPDWSAHHQPVARGTLSGRVVLRGPATGGGWDPDTGPVEDTPGIVLFAGPFRAQSLAGRTGSPVDAAGQPVTVKDYLLVVSAEAPVVPVGTRCHVEECPDDPYLVGKVLTVKGPLLGSHRFERDMYVTLDLSNQPEGVG